MNTAFLWEGRTEFGSRSAHRLSCWRFKQMLMGCYALKWATTVPIPSISNASLTIIWPFDPIWRMQLKNRC